ncbi:hypothetical protein R8Z50_13045 [Longispora sp. K20-0274]|uniref:hypothetical protein n=1 Tax=Longispora sp. K20-0274 TaxID=3088255 RepID=UPI003999F50B
MTTTSQPDPVLSADTGGAPGTAGGGITRLRPADGLFLRAEHLIVMQDYARELALSVGLAAGTGVVHGYRVRIEGSDLCVDPGLAISPTGRPLRSWAPVKVALHEFVPVANGFWVVEVAPAEWLFGEENVYGNLCDDPCSTGAPIRPFSAEGVRVELTPDVMPGLGDRPGPQRRNWLASAYFERERVGGGPWLTPVAPNVPVAPITTRDWRDPTGAPDGDRVPIALLVRIGDAWVVDVWAARRDVGDPPPRRAWQSRLGMRPWDVFVAQVLQFQDQLARTWSTSVSVPERPAVDLTEVLDEMRAHYARMRIKPHWIDAGISAMEGAIPAAGRFGPSLRDLGFDELPPAGYLPAPPADRSALGQVRDYAAALFGDAVELRVCQCRADAVAEAVEESRNLDRIPLVADGAHLPPRVDILVPSVRADLPGSTVPSYPWIAFVRHRVAECAGPRETDEVDVYVVDGDYRPLVWVEQLVRGEFFPSPDRRVARLTYAPEAYSVPAPHDAYHDIHARPDVGGPNRRLYAVGLASSEDRQPLAVARATLLAMTVGPGGQLKTGEVFAGVRAAPEREAIVIVTGDDGEASNGRNR